MFIVHGKRHGLQSLCLCGLLLASRRRRDDRHGRRGQGRRRPKLDPTEAPTVKWMPKPGPSTAPTPRPRPR